MFKLIGIVVALIPVFLFLRNIFGRSAVVKNAVVEFQKQIDYLVWVILFLIAVGLVYSLVNLVHPMWG
jgi:ABC-type phosphate/phosphonate transport system permease subunit